MEVYMPPYSDNDDLSSKIDKIIGGRTNMNPPASKTVDMIHLLVSKIEELEIEIRDLKGEDTSTKPYNQEAEYFILARSHDKLNQNDIVKVSGIENKYPLVEKINDVEVLVVDSVEPDDDGKHMIKIYGRTDFNKIELNQYCDCQKPWTVNGMCINCEKPYKID